MGNFNLKNIWAPKAGGGGSIPSNLEQRVQNLENDTLKLGASAGLQEVRHMTDFYENVVFKNEAFVDRVGNGNTNIPNKQYVDTKDAQNVKLTEDQSIAGNKTFTGNTSFNNQVAINSQGQDFTWETTRTWANNVDNTVARTKDFKFVRQIEYISNIAQPNNQWNKTSWNWTWNGLNIEGLHEVLVIISIENIPYSLNAKLVWKNGVSDSISPLLIVEHGDTTYHFQLVIKSNNRFHIYTKKLNGTKTIQWVRIWLVRGVDLPWKMNQIW